MVVDGGEGEPLLRPGRESADRLLDIDLAVSDGGQRGAQQSIHE
jgi:hypothetical protein